MPHPTTKQAAYKMGGLACLAQLNLLKFANYSGFPAEGGQPETQQQGGAPQGGQAQDALPPEALAAMHAQGQQGSPADQLEAMDNDAPGSMPDASTFVDFAQTDDTEEATQSQAPEEGLGMRQPNWSGRSSLESGDAGMRNHEMGIPRSSGV